MIIRKIQCIFIALGALFGLSSCAIEPTTEPSTHLLDDNLSLFENVYDYGNASFKNDEIQLQATKNWFFTTRKRYQDFILTAEVMMPNVNEYSNSGIIFRGQIVESDSGNRVIGYQAEIDPSPRKWTGGLFDQGRRKWLYPIHTDPKRTHRDEDFVKSYLPQWGEQQANAYKHLEWNKIRIECRGDEIKIFINDTLTTHAIDTKDSEGVIGLQHHGSKALIETGHSNNIVRFRNIEITELN